MPLDPQVESLLSEMAALGGPPIHELSVAEARTVAEGMTALAGEPIEVGSQSTTSRSRSMAPRSGHGCTRRKATARIRS